MRYTAIVVCSFSFFLSKNYFLPPLISKCLSKKKNSNSLSSGWVEKGSAMEVIQRCVSREKNICHEILNEPNYRLQGLQHSRGVKRNRHLNKCALKHLSHYGLFRNFLPNITFNFHTSVSLRYYLFYLMPRVIINCCLSAHLYAACGD